MPEQTTKVIKKKLETKCSTLVGFKSDNCGLSLKNFFMLHSYISKLKPALQHADALKYKIETNLLSINSL